MAARTTVTLIKQFTYRGDSTEEFSNTYSFKAAPPSDSASWLVLANDLINLEKPIFPAPIPFVRAYGYDSDDPGAHSVWDHDFTTPGPPPTATGTITGHNMSGDQAACVEWKTDQKNGRGKWIYLRKYLHAGSISNTNVDQLDAAYLSTLTTYAAAVQSFWGGLTARRLPYTVTGHEVIPFVTTRSLKRRGKRPPLPA